jgi:hypothetical protein
VSGSGIIQEIGLLFQLSAFSPQPSEKGKGIKLLFCPIDVDVKVFSIYRFSLRKGSASDHA